MADGYISQIKTPDNKTYLLRDSEKTDEKVSQTSNSENKEFPIILKNTNDTTNETAGVKYAGGVTVNPSEKTVTADEFIGNLNMKRLVPISTKTYNAPLYQSSGANFYQNFATVTPTDYNAIWIAHYRITVTAAGHSDYTEICDVSISGRANTYYSYKIYNSIVTYSIYQHMLLNSNSVSVPHELGYRMQGSYGADSVAKVIKVELLEQLNCTVTLLDNLKLYTSATPSGYTWRGFNAISNGLQETGDNDAYGYYILSNGFKGKAGSNKVYRQCLFARTGDGTYESFVMESNTRATTKTANPHGFVPDGKIYWNSSGSDYSAGTLNISPYEQYHTLDYLYSFNFDNQFLPDYCETYVVYTYNEDDGLLYLDTTQWLAAALPTTEDGKIYQRIGSKYYTGTSNYYQGSLLLDNPYYEYRDGEIRSWSATHLSSITGADDLKAIEAISGTTGLLKKTATNTWTLDTNNYVTSSGITSVTIGATSPVQSSTSTAQNGSSASTTISLKDAYGDTKNPYGAKAKNLILAGPSSGNNAVPSFRALVAADIPNSILKWQTTTAESTALYDFGVYVNMNNANSSSMTSGNFFNILNVPYRKASGNTKADWGWQLGNTTSNDGRLWYRTSGDNVWGDWQTIAHAAQSTSDTGSSSQPVYMTKTGVITAITAVGAAYGGTGKTTLKDSANTLINALDTGSSDLTANDYVITQYVGGGTTTTSYHRRPVNKVVNATLVKAALGTDTSTTNQWLNKKGLWSTPTAAEVGAITKLNSSTDNAIVRFDGTTGAIQDSGVIINDNDHLIAPSIRIANTYYGIAFGRTTGTPKETILHTGIKWVGSAHMPVIHITGYAYGLQSPVEFKIGFYIYGDKIGWSGATNMGSWEPDIYLFKDTRSETNYVAVGLAGSCYFLQLSVDLQDEMGKFNNVIPTDWSWDFLTTEGTIPSTDDGTTCVKVPYKASIFGAKYASITTTSNAIAYYTNATGTFGSKASANGALYATSANGALQWGTLPIAQGGTGKTTANDAANALISSLPTWTTSPTADTYFIRRDTGGTSTFGQVKFSSIANITNGKITLGPYSITPVTSVNGHTGSSVSVTASDLGLASALKYVGTKSSLPTATDSTTYSTYNNGDVITVSAKEYAYVKGSNAAGSSWVELGDEGSYKLRQTAFTNSTGTADGTNTSTSFIYSFSQDENGAISNIKTRQLPTLTNVSYTAATDNNEYPILLKNSTGSDTTAAGVRFASGTNQQVTINPSTGTISTRRLVINNSSSNGTVPDLVFSRTSWSYINIPDNDAAVLAIGRGTGDNASQKLIIQGDGVVRPGSDNTQFLGTSARRWQKIYGVNFYGTFNGTATSAQQLAAREIDNSNLNQFSSGGALKYAWVGGGNSILSKPTDVNAFGIIAMKTATNWTGQLLMSTDTEPGLYWRTNLTTETPTYGTWARVWDSSNHRVFYGTCTEAAGTAAKAVGCANYDEMKVGDIVTVKFNNTNTAASPTLNVNGKGSKSVKMAYSGGTADLSSYTQLAGIRTFIYDGTNWILQEGECVKQGVTDTTSDIWRPVMLGAYNSTDVRQAPEQRYAMIHAARNVKYHQATGTLRAPILKTPKLSIEYSFEDKAHIQWNNTDSSIDFIFD